MCTRGGGGVPAARMLRQAPLDPWFTGHVISDRTLTAAAEASSLGKLAIDLRNQRI